MATGRLIDSNLVTRGDTTIAGGSTWSTAWPLANLLTESDYVGSPARCLNATDLSQSWLEVRFIQPETLLFSGLFFHSMSIGARYRIRATSDADVAYAAPVLDTGWQWVFPSIYDPVDLPFGVENFWSGTVTFGDLDLFKRHSWGFFDEVLAQRVRMDIDDQANPDGFVDIGGWFLAQGFSPELNFDRGRELAAEARDLVDEAPSGRRFAEERSPRRNLTISYSNLEDAEARRFLDAAMRARTTRTVVFIPDLDDQASLVRDAFPATFKQLPSARIGWPGLAASGFTVEEILA
jgi:hypothetical protein